MKTKRVTTSNRLGTYLTATVGTSLLAAVQSDAAIVTIDLGPTGFDFAGPNGNAPPRGAIGANPFPMVGGGGVYVANGVHSQYGIFGFDGLYFASGGLDATPTRFSRSEWIGSEVYFIYDRNSSLFSCNFLNALDFGPGSYMGFRVAEDMVANPLADPGNPNYDATAPALIPNGNYYYGWLEVTWTSADSTFEIISGAYESDFNKSILSGDTGASAIPEPASALSTLGLLASGMMIRRRSKKAA